MRRQRQRYGTVVRRYHCCSSVALLYVSLLGESTKVSGFATCPRIRPLPKRPYWQLRVANIRHPLIDQCSPKSHRSFCLSAESAAGDISSGSHNVSSSESDSKQLQHAKEEEKSPRIWPCFDELDSKLIRIAVPVIANFAISPLIGAVDLFWINRMGNALAVAGQAAANQVFNSAFWLASFLPSGKLSSLYS